MDLRRHCTFLDIFKTPGTWFFLLLPLPEVKCTFKIELMSFFVTYLEMTEDESLAFQSPKHQWFFSGKRRAFDAIQNFSSRSQFCVAGNGDVTCRSTILLSADVTAIKHVFLPSNMESLKGRDLTIENFFEIWVFTLCSKSQKLKLAETEATEQSKDNWDQTIW